MTKKEIENRLKELKGLQSDFFKKKKADRNVDELQAVRDEMNSLKEKVTALNRGKAVEEAEA